MSQLRLLSALSLVLVLVAPAIGQEGFRRFRGFGRAPNVQGLSTYVQVPEVQQELSLQDDQIELLVDLNADINREVNRTVGEVLGRRTRSSGEDTDERQERQKRFAELQAKLGELNNTADQLVLTVLTLPQGKRVKQIRLQHEGVRAFDRSSFREQLKLTDEQNEQINAAKQAIGGAILRRDPSELESKIKEVLTEEQLQSWNELKGKEFKFPSSLIVPRR